MHKRDKSKRLKHCKEIEELVYKNRQEDNNFLTINIKKWGTKNKVVENTS